MRTAVVTISSDTPSPVDVEEEEEEEERPAKKLRFSSPLPQAISSPHRLADVNASLSNPEVSAVRQLITGMPIHVQT